jgi:hypothetical protein
MNGRPEKRVNAMPNRIIKESINESKGLGEVSAFAQDLYKRLITYADDYGRFNVDIEIMRARLYPRELESVYLDDLEDAITELVGICKIGIYKSQGREGEFGCFPNWADHQRIRNTRAKTPEPEEFINDWALKRFVPIALKLKIYERDQFTCQECRHSFMLPEVPPKRALRLLNGALHIDHIVPVSQGGRATEENLRLLCASCNLRRQRIINWSSPPQVAAGGRRLRRVAARARAESNPNPIQSNPNPTSSTDVLFETFWKEYPKKQAKPAAMNAFHRIGATEELVSVMVSCIESSKKTEAWQKEKGKYVPQPATWLNNRRWEDKPAEVSQESEYVPEFRDFKYITEEEECERLLKL